MSWPGRWPDPTVPGGNADIVRRLYEGFNRERRGIRELLDPKIEYVNPDEALEAGTRRGIDEWSRVMRGLSETFSTARVDVKRIVESGERVAAVVTFRVRGGGSGVETEQRQGHLWTIREGKAVRFEWFNDPERALKAVGAGESD